MNSSLKIRLDEAGLTNAVIPLADSLTALLMTWLAPVMNSYYLIDQLQEAGALSVAELPSPEVSRHLIGYQSVLGDEVCVLWPYSGFGAVMQLEDFANHIDELWYPGNDDIWLFSFARLTAVTLNHEELLLDVDLTERLRVGPS